MKTSLLKLLIIVSLSFSLTNSFGQGAVYVTDQSGEPWGSQSCIQAMTAVFGNGGYTTSYYQNVNPNTLFVGSNCLIYMEGGMNNDISMNNFITNNQVASCQHVTWLSQHL